MNEMSDRIKMIYGGFLTNLFEPMMNEIMGAGEKTARAHLEKITGRSVDEMTENKIKRFASLMIMENHEVGDDERPPGHICVHKFRMTERWEDD